MLGAIKRTFILRKDELEDAAIDVRKRARAASRVETFDAQGAHLNLEETASLDVDNALASLFGYHSDETYSPHVERLKWEFIAEYAESRKDALK